MNNTLYMLVLILLYMAAGVIVGVIVMTAILHPKGLKRRKGAEIIKKYELLTGDTINLGNRTLYRIKALRDFGNVKKGDLGGYIEKEENLSHKGSAWVYDLAMVFDSALVFDSACVRDLARVRDSAMVFDSAMVCGSARIFGSARVFGSAEVFGSARIFDSAEVCGSARVESCEDYIAIAPIGSRNDVVTFFNRKDNSIGVKAGCFQGTIDGFLTRVGKAHGDNEHAQAYRLASELAKLRIGVKK